ncbi:MAG: hydroxymethylglutaryl-CoA reductase, degradative [Caldilineaceae bacterium]|nr:hydroxymethylglutaryl-CoA reductase, degradative [Caldilineaceae bacterium]HRJ41052.1 hydroxymethylglutaryl-CoA reductase, degradative [Caldilineaceae bacterium]
MSGQRPTSRISGFYQKSIAERVALLSAWAGLDREESAALDQALSLAQADKLIENVVGRYALPLGIGTNFLVNGKDYLIPLVVEEPSIVAALSYAARLARSGGGFVTGSTEPVMIGQVQLLDVADPQQAESAILAAQDELLAIANTSPTIARLGGGPRAIRVRHLPRTPTGPMLIVHLLFDCRDAMGANAINTAVETIAPRLEALSGGRALLRILSNLSDQRRAWAEVAIPATAFSTPESSGEEVIQAIAEANAFAVADPYRAATHNKGIFNGIDPLLIATGNDWRAVEAGGHAYAARSGQYRALTEWRVGTGDWGLGIGTVQSPVSSPQSPTLFGRLELPLSVGVVGGATRSHPTAQVALKILGVSGARELSEVAAAVGLAQNLAALRALVTDGIQRGHMRLHARQVAVAAGAPPARVDEIAQQLIEMGEIRVERARQILGIGE